MIQPISYLISEKDFDLALLPKAGRARGSDAFRQQVTQYFRNQYAASGGEVTVEFRDGNIAVTWMPAEADQEPAQAIYDRLQAGDYAAAVPMLAALLQVNPRDHEPLNTLGMVYSPQGRLAEAQQLLRQATEIAPDHAHSWIALGVAYLRTKDAQAARPVLERALALEPRNPYALRTLGSLQAMTGDAAGAIGLLRQARELAPDDPIVLLTLAQALLSQDPVAHAAAADGLLTRVLELSPHGTLAEQAKNARRALASQTFRGNAVGALRHDALFYCLSALERFAGMSKEALSPIVLEMATLGQSGLNVNDPEPQYHLRLVPGDFSGLQIVCMMHVGLKQLDPSMDAGMDLDREYEAALSLYARNNQP